MQDLGRCVICEGNLPFPDRRTCGNTRCETTYVTHLRNRGPVCLVCFRPLTMQESLWRVCSRGACQQASPLARLTSAGQVTCTVCPAPARSGAGGTCGSSECHRLISLRVRAERARRQEAARHRVARQLRARGQKIFDSVLATGERAATGLAIVPTFDRPLATCPERRKRRFRDHLDRTLREATEGGGLDPVWSSEGDSADSEDRNDTLLPGVCRACQGYCCSRGGEHGYLKREDLRRYLDRHPEKRPRDVLADFLERLPARSHLDSCVFHTDQGCNLPRTMRSGTCRQYLCQGVVEFRQEFAERPLNRVLVLAREGSELVRGHLICDSDTRVLDLSAHEPTRPRAARK